MLRHRRVAQAIVLGIISLITGSVAAEDATIRQILSQELIGLNGKEGVLLTVEYAPSASSAKHRHHAYTFVYVLEGTVVMQIEGGDAVTLGPGETFYESPDDIHLVSKNASDSERAKFLVFFVKEKIAPQLVPLR